jgi:hypothetical protein
MTKEGPVERVRCPLCLGNHGCRACAGVGEVTPEGAERISAGIRMRWDRHRRGKSAKAEAARLGISLGRLINMELGLDGEYAG